ncbi:MAG: hypothetical protein CL944_03030 [Candidatus Diapherotrites archaeon]|uniref:Class III signal peptide-containing protein n=1 Tax=Candidatus Iainarchaeum sp. TaxID=3101447 RepID=A0A2D6LQG7_9ARCH|nr:hypothetical protein [Candidatus Diapherotrites archaeon]|tara:strand:- start:4701 stop:5150 length:450 start_codon:yes stop_codon:yes gene_type:complete
MIEKKGQGTTEYLIILAVIIVVALVVAGVMGWFPGLGTQITEQQSRAYWQSTSPLAITQWDNDGTNIDFILRNQTTDKIQIDDISVDGLALGLADVNIAVGGQTTFTDTDVTCTAGDVYQYDIVLTYTVQNGLVAAKQTGSKPLVGICS